MKIVIDKDIPFIKGVLEPFAEVVYLSGEAIGPEDVREADALLIRTRTRCGPELLNGSRVRFIGTATIGFDHIDREWCAARGIRVATAAGCNARAVLQWVSAALAWLSQESRVKSYESANATQNITIGVIGVGSVGRLVAEYAAEWGFRVMCSDPPREEAEGLGEADGFYSMDKIITEADILTLHVPLTDGGMHPTRGMVGRDLLAAMKPGAVILNSSRGEVIDNKALINYELRITNYENSNDQGPTFIFDVWNGEPEIDRGVLERVALGTPHIAGYTQEGKAMATAMIVRALAAHYRNDKHTLNSQLSTLNSDWYPVGARRSLARKIGWGEMCEKMPAYFDIAALSKELKATPERFEEMRNGYRYREEFF